MINDVTLAGSPLAIKLYVHLLRGAFRLLQPIGPGLAARLALKIFLTPPATRASRWERKFEQEGTLDFVTIGNKRLRVLTHGTGDKTVLLVHGWGSRGTHLGSYADALSKQGYRVCTMDGPAHGQSTGKGTDMMEFAQAIAAVSAHVGGVDIVVGHSFGAACTLLSISRFGLAATKLVLISCFSDAVFITDSFARFFRIKASVIHAMRVRLERRHRNAWRWDQIAPARLIRGFDRPILLIHDEDDDEVPFRQAQELHSNHIDARLFSTRKQGHRKILRDKTGIAATLAFLNEVA